MSIFSRYRAHLETELVKQEQLFKLCLAVKERVIQRQDEEIKMLRAKCDRLELLVIPGLRQATNTERTTPRQTAPEGETSWNAYLTRHMKEEEEAAKKAKEQANGVHGQERQGLHQSASSDAVGQNGGGATGAQSATGGKA